MSTGATHVTQEAEQPAPQVAAPEPVLSVTAPVPLMVGHAEDRAERDADAMADSALGRLRSFEGDTHSHGPGCDHSQVRRSAAPPSGAPVVGYEGGALDSGTSSAIESRRGGGRALDADVRRRMETAFNTSFSSVRIHDDSHAAKLNSAVSATAFTTGKDIFFGSQQYAPGTPGGDRVLAHELAHTLQPEGDTRRQVATAPGVSPRAHAAIVRSVATTHTVRRGFMDYFKKKPAGEAAPAAAPPKTYQGGAGKLPTNLEERGKAGVVGTVVGGAKVAGMATSGTGVAGNALGGAVGGAAGLLTTADALTGLNNARKMGNDAETYGDKGMGNLSDRKYKNQGMQALGGAVTMAKGGVEMGYLAGAGESGIKAAMKSGAANGALGAAAGGLGVAVGSVQTLQGLWKSGKAVQKLCRLTWGRSQEMYSKRGKGSWKPAILSAEKFKLGVGVVKTALGVLGIAAGALLIVSNPIGWGIGIAAAIAGGVYAATKIGAKIRDASKRTEIAKQIQGGQPADEIEADGGGKKSVIASNRDIVKNVKKANERSQKKNGGAEVGDDVKARNVAIEKANEVARLASHTAVIASEMREAMLWADDTGHEGVWGALEAEVEKPSGVPATFAHETWKELYDAYMLLSSINVTREEAVAPSGQELIEKKLSKMESM